MADHNDTAGVAACGAVPGRWAAEVAGVVLAAGAGTRLRPLTAVRPKALCPVGGVPLVDLAIARVEAITSSVAVNVHHGRALLEAHLAGRIHLSLEPTPGLGTAGALGYLRSWIDGRPVLVVNADAWTTASLASLVEGWDGSRLRFLLAGTADVSSDMRIAGALLPWATVRDLAAEPSGLWEASWRDEAVAERVEAVRIGPGVPFVDCGTPAAYLAANMVASGGESVVGAGAVVDGEVVRTVVWPGGYVHRREHLVDCVRVGDRMTVTPRG